MRKGRFDRVPNHYSGPVIQRIKEFRHAHGRKSLLPTLFKVGQLELLIPRHFGFCFGVERAIHMAFCALNEAPQRSTYLVSEIIHNPLVNHELERRGIRFLFDAGGRRQVPEDQIAADDLVLIPAFGTTVQIEASLRRSGIDTDAADFRRRYDTTCPFVSKVWKRGEELGRAGYTIVIHGKFNHEETQATYSHIQQHAHTVVVLDSEEARLVAEYIRGRLTPDALARHFGTCWSPGFDLRRDLERLAVVNQTTMLAGETREVSGILRAAMQDRYGADRLEYHWVDTSDTLCYATNQNQNATMGMRDAGAELAVIVGGCNSSNTAHLVRICADMMPSYLVENQEYIISAKEIRHFDIERQAWVLTRDWLPHRLPGRIAVTSGASCPDVLMNQVITRIVGCYGYGTEDIERGMENLAILDSR